MIERFVYLQPALEALDVKNAFENPKKQRNWQAFLEQAKEELQLLQAILPCFTLIAQCVQILSASDAVTISLVRLACSKIQDIISDLDAKVAELNDISATQSENAFGKKISSVVQSLQTQFDIYFGISYEGFYPFIIGEFLDPRTFLQLQMKNMVK